MSRRLLAILAAFGLVACARLDVIEPVPPGPGPSPVDPVVPGPVDPATPKPFAPWDAVVKIVKGLTVAEVRAILGVDPAYSSVDTGNAAVVSDYRIVDDTGRKQYLSVTFKAGVVDSRIRIPRSD